MSNKFLANRRGLTEAQLDKKERKANRRVTKERLAEAIVRNAREQGITSLAKPGAAKKLVDRLLKAQLAQMKTALPAGEPAESRGPA